MNVTLDLPPETVARLEAEAARRRVSIDQLVVELPLLLPCANVSAQRRRLAFIGLGASTSGRAERDADEMLAEGFGRD